MRQIDFIQLMGPPGAGKSTLGAALNQRAIASYTELEPILVARYGRGEEFAKRRPEAHEWIWDFYRGALVEETLPVVMETTGIAGRSFLAEIAARYSVMLVRLTTPRATCITRVLSRPKGAHVNDQGRSDVGKFFDYWHGEIAPTYHFDIDVSGMDVRADTAVIAARL